MPIETITERERWLAVTEHLTDLYHGRRLERENQLGNKLHKELN